VRQAVEQVEIEAPDAMFAKFVDGFSHQIEGLHAVDRLLHRDIEILDPQADPRHAGFGHRPHHRGRGEARIELHRDLAVGRGAEAPANGARQRQEPVRRQDVGCSPAPMDLRRQARFAQKIGDQHDLLLERFDELHDRPVGGDDLGVAAAVPAHAPAEWHMQIERQGLRGIGVGKPALIDLRPDPGMELRRRGIGRVARNRPVIGFDDRTHGRLIGRTVSPGVDLRQFRRFWRGGAAKCPDQGDCPPDATPGSGGYARRCDPFHSLSRLAALTYR
jgi:hypothetical protein